MKRKLLLIGFLNLTFMILYSVVINIPADQETIQMGIDIAVNGDTILVQQGIYYENIDFNGKDIIVASLFLTTDNEEYIYNTIIDGNQESSVVVFENGESNNAKLIGFTIQNGNGYDSNGYYYSKMGGGIFINFSSPSLINLIVENNFSMSGGGIFLSSTDAYFEGLTIRNNYAFSNGGGISINRFHPNPTYSDISFSDVNKCNIYNNSSGMHSDIFIIENHTPEINVIVDSFTVIDPDHNFISQFPNLNLNIENGWLEQVPHDLYVSPIGDNNSSGLTAEEPLKTIQWALTKIKADSLHPRNIYLSEGIYSPASNGEQFALNMRAYVNLIGAGVDETIFEETLINGAFIYADEDDNNSVSNMTFRNNLEDESSSIPLTYWDSSGNFSNLKIENCVSEQYSAIVSGRDITMNNVEIINTKGSLALSFYSDFLNNYHSRVILNNVTIIGNTPSYTYWGGSGGALRIHKAEYASVTNCLFSKNVSNDNYWPMCNLYLSGNETLDFFNNTVVDNFNNGGAICFYGGGEVNIKNSIIRQGYSQYLFQTENSDEPTIVNIEYSNIQGGTDPSIVHYATSDPYPVEFNWGEGIIDEEPLFVGGEDEYNPLYYQLSEDSPCIDSGNPDTTGLFLPPWDLLYNNRIYDGDNDGVAIIDMGCYEFGADSVGINQNQIPYNKFELTNYPNPFNPTTTISFNLSSDSNILVEIYNIKGQKVKILINEEMHKGQNLVIWNGLNENNQAVSSGVYFYKVRAGKQESVKRMILLK